MDNDRTVNRREFLQASAAAAAATTVSGAAPVAAALPIAAPAVAAAASVTPVHLLLNGLGQAYGKLCGVAQGNHWTDTFNDFFGHYARRDSADAFVADITGQIDHLYKGAALLADYLRKLQDAKEEAQKLLSAAFVDMEKWENWDEAINNQLLISTARAWIAGKNSTEHKMQKLRQFFSARNSFDTGTIDWNQTDADLLADMDRKLAAIEKRSGGEAGKALPPMSEKEEKAADVLHRVFYRFLWYYASETGIIERQQPHTEAVDKALRNIELNHRLNETMLCRYRQHRRIELPWSANLQNDIRFSIDESPEAVIENTRQAVRNIPDYYNNYHWDPCYDSNGALREEVLQQLPGFIERIIPQMMEKYFPETVHKPEAEKKDASPSEKSSAFAPHYIADETLRLWELKEKLRATKQSPPLPDR